MMREFKQLARIVELRTQIRESLGQVVMAIMNPPRNRHQSLGDRPSG